MSEKTASIAGKSLWTIGSYVASAGIRFSSNIVLSRLLGPEILGILVIAQAVRGATELLTDVGLEQNVVHSAHGNEERFLNTVWTIQVVRGLIISLICAAFAPVVAGFYRVEIAILLVVSAAPLLSSFLSTSLFSMAKRLDVRNRNLFDLTCEAVALVINVALAFYLRNVWAPIIGLLLGIVIRSTFSYLLPHPRHRFLFDKKFALEIFHFSKWIMVSSFALYLSVYVDRLFLGRVVTLATLGVYGLAKAVADLPQAVAGRLAFQIVFPFVTSHREDLLAGGAARSELGRTRLHFLLLVLVGIGTVMAWSDWAVYILYGKKFAAAGWMLYVLLMGSWIGVLASLNEAVVFGFGRAGKVSFANGTRLAVMAAMLPIGWALLGLNGVLLAVPLSEFVRYAVLLFMQKRLGATFIRQDAAMTFGLIAVLAVWTAVRMAIGLGAPWH